MLLVLLSLIVGLAASWDLVPDNCLLLGSAATAGAGVVALVEDADGALVACNAAAGAANASAPCSDALIVKFNAGGMASAAAAPGVEEE